MLSYLPNLRPLLRKSLFPRRLAALHTAASTTESATTPDAFKGIHTNYGWVLVKSTHVARSWTQSHINTYLEQHLPPKHSTNFQKVQQLVDEWMKSADLESKPKHKKLTAEDIRKQEELKLFMRQSKDEGKFRGVKVTKAKAKAKRNLSSSEVTFTYAWNYFMAMTYPNHKDLPAKEARKLVAAEWRSMSMDQKDIYRQEYSDLLSQGKDILHGKIVDREVKLKSTERLQLSKERSSRRKMEALKEMEESINEGIKRREMETDK